MQADRPPRQPGSRRVPTAPVKIPTGPPIRKFVPYIAVAVVVAVLLFLVRTPRFASFGALGIALAVMVALGYACLSDRSNLAPDDPLRSMVPIVAVVSLIAAALPIGYTIFPPPAQAEIDLAGVSTTRAVTLKGNPASLWLAVSGRFVPTATGNADYFLSVSKDGGPSQRIFGRLYPHMGKPIPDQQVLTVRGSGRFVLRLDQLSSAIAPPLHVAIHAKPVTTLTLLLIYALLAVVILALDAKLWQRNIEPSLAAALLLPLVTATYFQLGPPSDAVPTDLLRAAMVGVLGGGLGGEILARVVRMTVTR